MAFFQLPGSVLSQEDEEVGRVVTSHAADTAPTSFHNLPFQSGPTGDQGSLVLGSESGIVRYPHLNKGCPWLETRILVGGAGLEIESSPWVGCDES